MFKNPFLNAASASVYIFLVVMVMTFITQPLKDKPDTFMAPIAFLSVFTLSVAVMVFLFFYQPLQLFIDGKKKEAVNLCLKTVITFGIITLGVLLLLFSKII